MGTAGLGVRRPHGVGVVGAARFGQSWRQSGQRERQASKAFGALLGIVGHLFGIVGIAPALSALRAEVRARLVPVAVVGKVTFTVNPSPSSSATSDHGV